MQDIKMKGLKKVFLLLPSPTINNLYRFTVNVGPINRQNPYPSLSTTTEMHFVQEPRVILYDLVTTLLCMKTRRLQRMHKSKFMRLYKYFLCNCFPFLNHAPLPTRPVKLNAVRIFTTMNAHSSFQSFYLFAKDDL